MVTWSVKGTFYEEALQDLKNLARCNRIDLMAVQETKQKRDFVVVLENYNFFNSGYKKGILERVFCCEKGT